MLKATLNTIESESLPERNLSVEAVDLHGARSESYAVFTKLLHVLGDFAVHVIPALRIFRGNANLAVDHSEVAVAGVTCHDGALLNGGGQVRPIGPWTEFGQPLLQSRRFLLTPFIVAAKIGVVGQFLYKMSNQERKRCGQRWQWSETLVKKLSFVVKQHAVLVSYVSIHSQEWSMSNFPYSLTRNIISHSMKNLAFHSTFRWNMIILPILTVPH